MCKVENGTFREPTPIGFYFARLWYFERLYPLIYLCGCLRGALAALSVRTGVVESAVR